VITTLQVTGLLLTVPLVLVLAPRLGILGAGLALLLSTTARLIFVLVSYPLSLKIRPPRIIPTGDDIRFLTNMISQRLRRERTA
jgi:O-antigen/teichoic acid export membrane protein